MRSAVVICVVALFVVSLATIPLVSAAIKHGCAPSTPPAVSGTLIQPPANAGLLFVNEVLLVPHSTWNCSEGNTYTPINDAWVELYNAQDQPFDLYAVHASLDSGANTNPFRLPFGSAIAPHGFLIIFPRTNLSFLSTETSTLRLLINGIVVDQVIVPSLTEDQAYARIPDGTSNWQIVSTPTIDASNAGIAPTPTLANHSSSQSPIDGRSSSSSANGTSRSGSAKIVDGVQPAWSTLQLPTSDFPIVTTTDGQSSLPSLANGGMDIPRKILLTLLVLGLALALLWCWRLFRRVT